MPTAMIRWGLQQRHRCCFMMKARAATLLCEEMDQMGGVDKICSASKREKLMTEMMSGRM